MRADLVVGQPEVAQILSDARLVDDLRVASAKECDGPSREGEEIGGLPQVVIAVERGGGSPMAIRCNQRQLTATEATCQPVKKKATPMTMPAGEEEGNSDGYP